MIRSFWQVTPVLNSSNPQEYIQLKIYYPATEQTSEQQGLSFAIAENDSPYPIVILLNGIDCEARSYHWLAVKLAEVGLVVITYNWVSENIPGVVSLTPGVDLAQLRSQNYGDAPTASALETIIKFIDVLNQKSHLAGHLDERTIFLGGHSAGARVAIESASTRFFPGIKGAFSYGGHTLFERRLAEPKEQIKPLPADVPLLILGGTEDGVIAYRASAYGLEAGDNITPLTRTFDEGITRNNGDSYLAIIKGANHFCFTDPQDKTISSFFWDLPCSQSEEVIRDLIFELIELFINMQLSDRSENSQSLEQKLNNSPLIVRFLKK